MPGRAAEAAGVFAAASLAAAVMSAGVLRAPSERVFGMEIVGRHHDPFTAMAQFARPIRGGVYSQPVTDVTGALLERVAGPVAAYNWLVLLSFPLAAVTGYLLARQLTLSVTAASVAAGAYAFSPFHIAQAAYHPHVAQVHWMALYLLALWRCLEQATPAAAALLAVAGVAVLLSNFYGGLAAAVITPVVVLAHWAAARHAGRRGIRPLAVTVGALGGLAALGGVYAWASAGAVVADPGAYAATRADLFRYSAKWWSYLVPPVANPLLGPAVRRFWAGMEVREGLLEQQVSLGIGVVALGVIATFAWVRSRPERSAVAYVPLILAVAATALVCSLSPERSIGTLTFVRPSALLYGILPMFRSYARFGVVVQLMAALLAGIAVDGLRRRGTPWARLAWIGLVALVAGEYAVAPSAMWRDALPTAAHRWVTRQHGQLRVLDCTPVTDASASVPWLSGERIALLGTAIEDCTQPNLPAQLAAAGYTHVLVRRASLAARSVVGAGVPEGLTLAARFNDAQVLAVTAPVPSVYTATMHGFWPGERDDQWAWRWMGASASWTIVNTAATPIAAALTLELAAFQRPRRLELLVDGRQVATLSVGPSRGRYQLGPILLPTGAHDLIFQPADPPTVAAEVLSNGDHRPLSFALGTWAWRTGEEQP